MQRKTDSRQRIKEAFIKLIHEKGFEQLTITDIARETGLNRGTFYLHYKNKYDLMDQLEITIINDLNEIMLENTDTEDSKKDYIPFDSILKALVYVKNDFELVEALASENGDPNFMNMVKEVVSNMVFSRIDLSKNLNDFGYTLPIDYAQEILLSSIISIIHLWIKKGGEESPEDIAIMITKSVRLAPYELLV